MASLTFKPSIAIMSASSCSDMPVFSSLQEFSRGSAVNLRRYEELVRAFTMRYGREPEFIARAPGRVNLIGEHVDYCGYGVLPMAIEQDIAIACSRNDVSAINLSNMNPNYLDFSCPVLTFEISGHEWFHYFLCGYKGILESLNVQSPVGMNLLLDGNIPKSAGLSSSSAVVCCAALTTALANKVALPSRKALADLCAHAEHYIGTEGGGMDQAASFLSEGGKAQMITFNPIRTAEVQLPSCAVFIVSNCLVEKNKAASADFNERVVECRLAAQVMAKLEGLDWHKTRKLVDLQNGLQVSLQEMPAIVDKHLHVGPYSRQEVLKILGITDEELVVESLSENTKEMQVFQLHKRAMHVYSEAGRVYAFRDTANSGGGVEELGKLMNESHAGLSKLYECSCKELEQLVETSLSLGAVGSRLTGAGWGGCTLSLVREDQLGPLLVGLAASPCYQGRDLDLTNAIFATKPSPGAAVCKISK